MPFSFNDIHTVGEVLAFAARTEIMPRFGKLTPAQVRRKSSTFDLVTEADEAAEVAITAALKSAFPDGVWRGRCDCGSPFRDVGIKKGGRPSRPITGRPPQSGRIEARTGLRMMPTSPRSPLSFRTAGFPQYGWKDGVSDGAFPTRRSVQACSRHTLTTYWFASVLRASRRIHECPAQCRVGYAPMHRRGGWVILLPRGPRSSPGCAVPVCHHLIDPIRPTRRHITTSPQGGLYAMPSLCGSA